MGNGVRSDVYAVDSVKACSPTFFSPSLNPDPLRLPVMGVMRPRQVGGGDQRRVVGVMARVLER